MSDERGVVRRIAWRELLPWLALSRAFRLATSPTVLLLATLGVFVASLGRGAASYIFLTSQQRTEILGSAAPAPAGERPHPAPRLSQHAPPAVAKYFPAEITGFTEPFMALSDPLARLFSYRLSINETAYYLFGFLWSLAVWSLVGGFITRRAIVQTAIEDTPGLVETARFAFRRWPWYFLAPLYPLLGILILLVLHVPLGWLMRLDVGVLIAGIVWFFVLLAGVAAAWLLLGTLLGWPLMWGALSAEREGDAFEAFSRSFSYVYGKPLNYLFYAVVAAILGALGYALAEAFIYLVTEFGYWAVSWGASGKRIEELRSGMALSDQSQTLFWGLTLLAFWQSVAYTFLQGYAFAYFWSAAGIIYLLLRFDVDEKEMDEVYLPHDEPAWGPPASSSSPSSAPATAASAAPSHAAPGDLAGEE